MAQISEGQMMLYRAIMTNDSTLTDSLTSIEGFNPNEVYSEGIPLLHLACMEGNLEMARLLISKGADVDLKDNTGFTPAKAAILRGRPEILDFLIRRHVDINQLDRNNQSLLSYLLRNSQQNQEALSKILLDNGIDVNNVDQSSKNALVYAIEKRFEKIGIQLINKGADVRWTDWETGMNLLHYCAIFGTPEIAEDLIKKGLDIDETDNLDTPPFIYALKYGHKEASKALSRNETDNQLVSEIHQRSPFQDIIYKGQAIFWNLHHRGWAIQTCSELFVFDYEEMGNNPGSSSILNGWLTSEELIDQQIISLYTCWHGNEHEGSPMHNMDGKVKDIQYVLNNDDIYKGKDTYIKLEQDETISAGNFKITAFRSDDISLGYLVEGNGLKIVYTGFPNINNYEQNVNYIKSKVDQVDVLMVSTLGMDSDQSMVSSYAENLIISFRPKYIIPKDNKRNDELNRLLKNRLAAKYPDIIWYLEKYPGDRRHINLN
jgi:ankyrin repeat protein